MTPAVNQCHFFLRCNFFEHLTSIHCGPAMAQCIWSFRSNGLNVYKVSHRRPAMYMEFWLALANVYKVLLATIEHPRPLCKVPQDGYCFLLTWWQASFLFTLQLLIWPSAKLLLKVYEVWDLNLALHAGAKTWCADRSVVVQTVVFETKNSLGQSRLSRKICP